MKQTRPDDNGRQRDTGCRIADVYPLKAQFATGERVALAVELENETRSARELRLRCTVRELASELARHDLELTLPAAGEAGAERLEVRLDLGPFAAEWAGYGADVELLDETGETISVLSTAFDVASDWRKATRYGFLSDFGPEEAGDAEDVRWMAKLHLNLVQFYDWMYRHDKLVGDPEGYTDLMGRFVSRRVVEEKSRYAMNTG